MSLLAEYDEESYYSTSSAYAHSMLGAPSPTEAHFAGGDEFLPPAPQHDEAAVDAAFFAPNDGKMKYEYTSNNGYGALPTEYGGAAAWPPSADVDSTMMGVGDLPTAPFDRTTSLGDSNMPMQPQPQPITYEPFPSSVASGGPLAVATNNALAIKREPLSPSSIASTTAHSPTLPILSPYHTPASSPTVSIAASGGSGSNSLATSDNESEPEERVAKRSKTSSKSTTTTAANTSASRKRKSKASQDSASDGGEHAAMEIADGVELDACGIPLTGDKRQQRLQRNRASAQLSRERKKQYIVLLEKQLKDMADLNESLSAQVGALTTENVALKARLAKLAMRERVAARYPQTRVVAPAASSLDNSSVRSGSDGDSTCAVSTPATPAMVGTGDAEIIDLPHTAKKLKVQPASNYGSGGAPRSPFGGASGAFNARSTMLLFGLIMSIGLVSHLIGLDTGLTTPQGMSRVASPAVMEPAFVPSSRQIVHLPARSGRVLASISDLDTSTLPKEEDAFALVPITHESASGAALPMTDGDDRTAKAVDVYIETTAHQQQQQHHPRVVPSTHVLAGGMDLASSAAILRQLLQASNSTKFDLGSKYLFAPSALRITEALWNGMRNGSATFAPAPASTPSEATENGEEDEKSLALFDRPRTRGLKRGRSKTSTQERLKARLPSSSGHPDSVALPAPTGAMHVDIDGTAYDLTSAPPLIVGDKLLLWVPLASVVPGAAATATMHNDSGAEGLAAAGGLVEIACSIAHVRPIVVS